MFSINNSTMSTSCHATPRMATGCALGWVRVIRGLRPPSEPLPVAHRPVWRSGQHSNSRGCCRRYHGRGEEVEAAIAALGADSVHVRVVQEADAPNKSRLPSVSERVESCKKFLERARQRVSRAQDVVQGHRSESSSRGRGQAATSPFQYALAIRVGCDAAHESVLPTSHQDIKVLGTQQHRGGPQNFVVPHPIHPRPSICMVASVALRSHICCGCGSICCFPR